MIKQLAKIFSFALLLGSLMVACKSEPKSETTGTDSSTEKAPVAQEAENYNVTKGTIHWIGSKPTGSKHTGTIQASGGQLKVAGGNVVGGNFTIDMNTIVNTDDMPDDKKGQLVGHLKSDDFFGVEAYPTGTFEITKVNSASGKEGVTHQVTGKLTLRDKTHEISFPANIAVAGDKVTAVATNVKIDRTKWDVKFNSTLLKVAAEQLINDNIELNIQLEASKG